LLIETDKHPVRRAFQSTITKSAINNFLPASLSSAPAGLVNLQLIYPRLAPWAAFLRRYAA